MAKKEKKKAEKDLEQVSGGYGGIPTAFTQAGYQDELLRKRELDQFMVKTAHKEPKHELGDYVKSMVNKLEGK